MNELRMHPFVTAAAAVVALVAVGSIIVEQRTAQPATGDTAGFSTGELSPLQEVTQSNGTTGAAAPGPIGSTTTPPFIPLDPTVAAGGTPADFDMAAFLAELSQPAPKATTGGRVAVDTSAYAYIPQGLISTSTVRTRTATQDALFEYGNEAGSFIQTYDDTHRDAPAVLKAQIEDRQSAAKGQAVKDIGAALIQVGRSLEGIEQVPASAAAANLALAHAYEDIGTKLEAVPDAERDQDLVRAIETYDAAVDVFNKKFIALATIFSLSDVRFDTQDPGSVFTFTQGGGL